MKDFKFTERHGRSLHEFCARALDKDAVAALERTLGVTLPSPGQSASAHGITVFWIADHRWLIDAPAPASMPADADGVVAADAAWRIYAVSGADAPTFLSTHCPLELNARHFPSGACRATLFEQFPVLICRPDETAFEIYVARSFAEDFAARLNPPPAGPRSAAA